MSAIEQLSITLEHDIDEQYQYQPGEVVRGSICIKSTRPTFIRTIFITIVGEGSVGWDDESTGETYTANETYINASKVVIDARGGRPKGIHVGNNDFPFAYQLPENLPSSYIGKYGSVTYLMKATVKGDKSIDQAITSEPFLCLRRSPLPDSIETPLELERNQCFWASCTFGNVYVRAGLNKQGGVPGEDLFVHAEVKNKSRRTITAVQASIIMHSTYNAKKYTTNFRQIVNKKRDEYDLTYNDGRRWSYVRLTVPPYIPESNLEYCDIIDLSYLFQFRVELTGGVEVKLEAPLLIGAHPAGLEIPKQEKPNNNINSQWTVKMKGIVLDNVGNGFDERDTVNDWHGGVPPELRSDDRSVINNPLFRHNSFMNRGGHAGMRNAPEEPPEIIENTKL
ncbi:arrestin domain-containing protein 4-like [Haliotis rubra]|uniref:arrestin domain-containing protein 4-like n=1 Tax=Haliotis rubra TaxID=36100 RepID=UPI001EE6058F|nr:arrestin domain-containing protein 4-like [Haliotis rubra]XP_046582649.1 arrestin domain-containing protein 4-like [Haliotis rubra]XP_046582650.1 arrestin domain-containing protein 4-like [Haliotis rubra]XP_046582651.1 arrestin domain-containing protein 4-like [Haliotis rubra]